MSNLNSRITKLEKENKPAVDMKTKVVYADQVPPEELQAIRADRTIGTLIVVEYVDQQSVSEISWQGKPVKKYIGLDMGKF